ncbi:MAG: hypothetical protein WC199_11085 [Dysgonamonadaceae bacterium]
MSTRIYLCVLFSIDIHHRYVAIMGTRNKIWLKRARRQLPPVKTDGLRAVV